MTAQSDPRLSLLTGAAIKLMAEAGADAAVIGHVAVHYPALVAQHLEPLPEPTQTPDIDVRALVREVIAEVLGSTSLPSQATKPAGRRGRGERIKRNVTIDGRRTSISLSADLLRKMAEQSSPKEIEKQIQAVANEIPTGEQNRSAWVESQLILQIAMKRFQGREVNLAGGASAREAGQP